MRPRRSAPAVLLVLLPALTGLPAAGAAAAVAPDAGPPASAVGLSPVAAAPSAVTPVAAAVPAASAVDGLPAVLRPGDRGAAVATLQERLAALGYWPGPVDGSYGPLTTQAVHALQKAAGLARDGVTGPRTQAALAAGTRPSARSDGDAVEIDLDRQLLLVVRGGEVVHALSTSTGTFEEYTSSGRTYLADTPRGTWQVGWAYDGLRVSHLGELYRPRYFHGDGIAVHGSDHVPPYPASHGCARVSDAAMTMIWSEDLMPIGSTVLVY